MPTITGIIYSLVGIALGGGGVWLAGLGGSLYYVVAGIGILITGILLIAGRRSALWVFAAVLIGSLIWAVSEVGFDWWPLAARGDIIFPMALWLLTPWITRNLDHDAAPRRAATLPLWAGVIGGAVVLVIAITSDYHDIDGTIAGAAASGQVTEAAEGQPDEDWQAYGRSQFGQRYSPLTQITRPMSGV